MMKRLLLLFVMGLISWSAAAQTSLEGKVTDQETGEPVLFATVALYKNGVLVTGTDTDLDGNYAFTNIDPGTYDVEFSYVGYQTQRQAGVFVNAGRANKLDIQLSSGINLEEVVVVDYEVPLVEQDNTTTGGTITSENIRQMPLKDINALAATAAGVSSQDGGAINIGGARASATVYYIDGMRVTGRIVPQTEIEQMQVLTGGIPAQYGDLAGGAISITTKGPSADFSGGLELETSEFLDPFGYNLFYGNLSGPILKDSEGKSLIGFRIAAQYRLREEDDPPALGVFRATEESIAALQENPLTDVDGFVIPSAEFYRDAKSGGPVQELSARPNENEEQLDITAKLDFKVSDNIDIQLTGTYFDGTDRFTPGGWDVFNYTRNPYQYNNRYRGIFRFRHRLGRQSFGAGSDKDKAGSNATIRNAVYTIEGGYQYASGRNEDLIHQDRLFDYGYVGQFNVDYLDRPGLVSGDTPGAVYVTDGGLLDTFYAHQNFQQVLNQDNPYVPNMNVNPILNNYNKLQTGDNQPRNLFGYNAFNGFLTGVYNNVWNLYTNVGNVFNTFSKNENEIFTLQANSSFDFIPAGSDRGRHNIQFGIFYEQRVNRGWNVSPFNLWTVARLQVNNHITGVNYDAPIDGETFELDGSFFSPNLEGQTYSFQLFEYEYEDPGTSSPFWRSLRDELNIPYYQPVNIDGIDPSLLSLDMFAPRELTDQGYVGYFGYDYLGNRTAGNITFDDFFTDRDENGNRTYLVAPYRPVWFAGYIQDKFTFKDINFRLGVRVERFDANTRVLRDQFSLYEVQSASEFFADDPGAKPANVGDDFKVYVTEPGSPSIQGFRNGNIWYDRNGTQLNDGNVLFQGGVVTPAYAGGEKPNIKSDDFEVSNSFEDYTPQWNVLPRLAFSFPISDEANFFANYDILAQRPNAGQAYVSPLQYFYFEDAGRTPLDNPNLRPVRTVNYEVGFRQKVSNSSAITISAFYREMRDLIQRQTVLFVASPVQNYDTYGNLDFGTVKEFKFQYDLRRTGNLQVRAIYRLQFADGTGSNADSQRGLTDRGNIRVLFPLDYDERHRFVANVDFRYASGKKYNGPKWFDTDVFANAGLNVQASAVSGRPFTPALAPGQFSGQGFGGGFNSARQPWTFNLDARLDKSWTIGRGEGNKPINLNVYLRAENLLNALNIVSVYTYTGSATNDGYLDFNVGQSIIQGFAEQRQGIAANEDVFIEAYQWGMINPDLFVRPRRLFLGAIVEF